MGTVDPGQTCHELSFCHQASRARSLSYTSRSPPPTQESCTLPFPQSDI